MHDALPALPAGRRITPWLWRLAILLLPWQIRWFSEGPMIDGYAWEQGRMAVYASWVLIVILCFVVWRYSPPYEGGVRGGFSSGKIRWLILGLILLLISSFFSVFPRATIQWWLEILMLSGFVWALVHLKIPFHSLAAWFVISLIPHALLGFQQYATQMVIESKWLGMAGQNPLTQGVSVMLHDGVRVLRAYGGFPHPNIFGGWLALALPLIVWLTVQAKRRGEKIAWMIVGGAFSIALVFTFSRGAWMAAFVGLIFVGWHLFRRAWVALLIVIVVFFGTVFYQRQLVINRVVTGERLEQKSVHERQEGMQNGIKLFLQHPLLGVGPGATGYALQSQTIPHFVPLLILDEVGMIGVIGLVLLTLPFLKRGRWRELSTAAFIPLIVILILSFFDHYPWSLWSGKTLVFLVVMGLLTTNPIFWQADGRS